MMRVTGLVLLLGVSALGCAIADDDHPDSREGSSPGGKLDDIRDSGTVFFVYANHRVCVAAPCPSYTVITPSAVRFDVARLSIEGDAEEVMSLVLTGGVLVGGTIEDGSWEPGAKGPAVHIAQALAPAATYLVARHAAGAASPYAVVTGAAIDHHVDRIAMDGFVAAEAEPDQTVGSLLTGEWATRGYVAREDTGEVVLFATAAAGDSYPCRVRASGIECPTAPCPVWRLESMDGAPLGHASELDLGYLHLSEEESSRIRDDLFASGGAVFGWLAEDASYAGGEDVLLVVRLLELPSTP